MTPNLFLRTALFRTCICVVMGIGSVTTAAQAQQHTAKEIQVAAGEKLSPLKLPPLPKKKFPTKKFEDWTQLCKTRPGATEEKCYLTQTVTQSQNEEKHGILAITVGLIGSDRKPGMALRVPLELGVLLPPGFKLNVPGVDPTPIAIQICLPIGCIARFALKPEVVAAMKKADKGSIELHTVRQKVVQIPVSFKGFTAALASLDKG